MNKHSTLIIVAIFLACLIGALAASAQYTASLGVRAGKFATGFTGKYFFDTNGNTGVEAWAAYTKEANDGYTARAFFIKQQSIFNSRLQIPVDFIAGAGIPAGYFKDRYYDVVEGDAKYYNQSTFAGGVGATIQLEYNSRRFPMTLGIDAHPFYNIISPGPEWIDFGVNLRYKIF